ncbi:MAG: chloride channel protein [Gemmatimonadota bacterium]
MGTAETAGAGDRGKVRNRLILDAILLGVVGALSAQLFMWMLGTAQHLLLEELAGYSPPRLPVEGGALRETIGAHGLWLIPLVTTLGGLVSGLLIYTFAPEAEGHGTDTAVKAFHRAAGFLRARVPPLKMIGSAITIGSGGAAGREGPTALISAGVGSLYGTILRRPEQERRMLVLIGMAAGLSAIFRSPIGTAIFAIEVLYSDMEFDADALLYTLLGAVVAYAVNGLFVGYAPLFRVPPDLSAPAFYDYGWYVLLGVAAGAVATILPPVFYGVRDLFAALPGPPHIRPAVGGLGLGILALFLPQVLGGGYGWIQEAFDGSIPLKLLLVLTFAKILALSLTVSSGGSGGVFAPSLFVGAMLGAALADLFHQPPAAMAVVGMAAVFAGAAHVPVATLLMVVEMTGGYHLLVPAALSVVLCYLTQAAFSRSLKYRSLYEAQVPGRADSPAHRMEHLSAALRLIGERPGDLLPSVPGDAELKGLLASGIPVSLPDGRQLILGVVRPQSPLAGMPIPERFPADVDGHAEVLAAFREGETHLPNSGFRLRQGDQVLVVTAPGAWERLSRHFSPILS